MVLVLIFFLSLYVFLLVSGDYEKQTDEEVKDDDKFQFTYSEAIQKIDDVFSLLPVSTRKTFTAC